MNMNMKKIQALEYLVDNFTPPYTDEWMLAGLSQILCEVIKSDSLEFTEEELKSLLDKSYRY